jgi:OPA family sugar phosphate sensor protein UhpC-like MFS transporter
LIFLHDTPESRGLPPVEVLAGESAKPVPSGESTRAMQLLALRTPGVWILAAASAFMYVSRYAVNSWGMLFLQEQKGFTDRHAAFVISINAFFGILGTVFSGWLSDKLFKSDRRPLALLFGICYAASLALFLHGGNAAWVNIASMVLFGISVGVLICFLGGLMAVDIVPRKAAGAAMGIVGLASYAAAGMQDIISGWLIDTRVTIVAGRKHYDFSHAALFWIAAAVISFLLPLLIRKKAPEPQE